MFLSTTRALCRVLGREKTVLKHNSASYRTMSAISGSTDSKVNISKQWVLGPHKLPIWTVQYSPSEGPVKAHVVFVHGFAEHTARYDAYFTKLAAAPSSLHITAFDQRGHGETAFNPPAATSEHVSQWKAAGHKVKAGGNGKRRSSWAENLCDIEFFVERELEHAQGKPVFLYGFSMGGGLAIAFATRGQGISGTPAIPKPETVNKLAGVIAGGPLLLQTHPAPWWQVAAGTQASKLLPNKLIPTPLNHSHLSHNEESNTKNKADHMCEQTGSLKLVSDMLTGGKSIVDEGYKNYPKNLPLLVVHGGDDQICDPKGSEAFVEKVEANDKQLKLFPGIYHEIHNELEPTPTECAEFVTRWIHDHAGSDPVVSKL